MEPDPKPARGVRFAPSPTGVFHIGNLRTAWVSERLARCLEEPWVVRFEDIDRPRVLPGAMDRQLEDMRTIGLVPDAAYLQSARHDRHFELFELARSSGKIYPCFCSRKEVLRDLDGAASAPHSPAVEYSGRCRERTRLPSLLPSSFGWRFRGEESSGSQDFLIGRSSVDSVAPPPQAFIPAYHWACAIDDYDGRYRVLVRAWDLESATAIQRRIQAWLALSELAAYSPPAVFHASLVVQEDGRRLEKRTRGVTLEEILKQGLRREDLLSRFSLSLDPHAFASLEGRSGEPDRTILLSSLLGVTAGSSFPRR